MEKTTLLIGGSTKSHRFSNKAIRSLREHSIPTFAIGLREGMVGDVRIEKPFPVLPLIHTITMYVGPQNQHVYYDFIKNTKPVRIIFNPGTENDNFEAELKESGVDVVRACTLVMLSAGTY